MALISQDNAGSAAGAKENSMNTRVVDTNEYVSALRELAEEGRVVSMLIAGAVCPRFSATTVIIYTLRDLNGSCAEAIWSSTRETPVNM